MNLPPYVAVTTAKNEQHSISATIMSVLNQSHPPELYVVVDDDSEDDTPQIIKRHPVEYIQIRAPAIPVRSFNMLRGLITGINKVTEKAPEWFFLLKIDADSILPEDYVERLLTRMESNPRVGIASGVMNNRKLRRTRPSDGAKIYRRECWDEIGGLDMIVGWDTHGVIKANKEGWNTRAYADIRYIERRSSRKTKLKGWMQTGFNRYYLGYPLFHTFWVAVEYLNDYPYILGSIVMILGHLVAGLSRNRPLEKSYYRYMQGFALWEIIERLRIRQYN